MLHATFTDAELAICPPWSWIAPCGSCDSHGSKISSGGHYFNRDILSYSAGGYMRRSNCARLIADRGLLALIEAVSTHAWEYLSNN